MVTDHGALTALLGVYLRAAGKSPGQICGAGFDLSAATARAEMDPGLQEVYAAGAAMPLGSYLDATNARTALGMQMRRFHESHDLLLTPALAVPAFEAGRLTPEGYDGVPAGEPNAWVYWTPFTYPFNLTQQPACTVPCGFTRAGLPVGLQIVGPMHADALVLRAARAYEAAHPFAMPSAETIQPPPKTRVPS